MERARNEGTDGRVLVGRINTLISQQPVALGANVILGASLIPVLGGVWPGVWLAAWVGAIWAVTAWRGVVWFRHRRGLTRPGDAMRVGRAMTVVATTSGAFWGLPGAVFFPPDPVALQGFFVFVIGGMSAAAVATLGAHLPAFRNFIVLTLLPLIARLALEADMMHLIMALMGAIYFVVMMVTGHNLNRMLTQSLRLQIEKSDLADELEEAHTQAEAANAAKSIFLATVSHELRTPLNAVLGFTHLVRDGLRGPLDKRKIDEYLSHVTGSGTHLLHLIDELLDLSRAEAGYLVVREESAVDLGGEVADCLAFLTVRAEHGGVALEADGLEQLPALRADRRRLRQILLNVLSNAVKFTPEGGKVTFNSERGADGALMLTVRDTGIGMAEEDLRVALEAFGRADSSRARATEGAGIGLPLTQLLMELHGGRMKIVSKPGDGTLVTLHFPAERVIENSVAAASSGPTALAR